MRVFIFCADPREEADLDRKIKEKLLRPGEKPVKISVLGGPICFAHPEELEDEVKGVTKQLRFAHKVFRFDEIVLVGHDCGYYANVSRQHSSAEKKKDMSRAVSNLKKIFKNRITAYYDCSEHGQTRFEEIREEPAPQGPIKACPPGHGTGPYKVYA